MLGLDWLVWPALLVLGILGFFVMSVVLVARFLSFIFRKIAGATKPPRGPIRFQPRGDVCPHPRCGHVNRAGAQFCARCGRPLEPHNDVDAYG